MSCLDKRHVTHIGGMQGHYKYTDAFSDTSSAGSLMDDTDREVSSLTDRAFKSLCIGDEAVYNDSEFASSPAERYDAFSLDVQNADILKFSGQKLLTLGRKQNGGGAAGTGEATVGATFQRSVLDMARKGLKNGAIETAWQQGRSALITIGGGSPAESHQRGHIRAIQDLKYKNSSNDLWENSALLNIRGELSDSAGHDRGHFQPTKNHVHSYGDATARTAKKDLEKPSGKSSKSKRGKPSKPRKPSNKNFFLHSEHSAFESWRDSNRILLEPNHTLDLMSTNQRPMWYDSPRYKELTSEHGLQISVSKEIGLNQSKSEDGMVSPATSFTSTPPTSTHPAVPSSAVTQQKAVTTENRSESESDACLPPWKRNWGQSRAALPWSVSSTAAPFGEGGGKSKAGAVFTGITNGAASLAGAAAMATPITPNSLFTKATPITLVTIDTPITSVAMATPVKMATPSTSTTMDTPVTSVKMATPITMATPVTSVKMATPVTLVTNVMPITSVTVVTPATSVAVVTPITSVKPVAAVKEPGSPSSTPFNISQLLTPIIPRQGTGTSEVLQSALTPSSLDLDLSPSSFTDASTKPSNDVKSRNSYKAIASGLLFNLKDNRKRVKSTYSPTKFKITDLSKQPSKPETAEPKTAPAISEGPVAGANASLQPKVSNVRPASEASMESANVQTVDHKKPADRSISDDYLTLSSPHAVKEATAYRNFNSAREKVAGKIQHAESRSAPYSGPEESNSDRTQWWERQDVTHQSLNLYKAASITEAIVPVVDMDVCPIVTNHEAKGIKEADSLQDKLCIKSTEVKHHKIRTRDRAHRPNDRKEDKQNEKVLTVKERIELFSKEKNDPKNKFSEQKRDNAKRGTFAKLDKSYTSENTLANQERENRKQSLTPVQEKERDGREDRMNHVFSARQNQYIKNERYTINDDDSDQADEDKDAIATSYNRHIFTSELEGNAEQRMNPGGFSTRVRHHAGDPEAQKSCEGVLLRIKNELLKNEKLAHNQNVSAQQEVFEETSDDVLPDNKEACEKVMHTTRGNPLTLGSSFTSTECLPPMQDTPLMKERAVEREALPNTENQQDEKEVPEEEYEIREEKALESNEKEMHFMGDYSGVKMGSAAEMNETLTTQERFSIVEKGQNEHCNEIKDSHLYENSVFDDNVMAVIKQEAMGRGGKAEKESSKVRDIMQRDREQKQELEGKDSDATKQNEEEKCTLIKEKVELKGNEKLASKEKDSQMKQICKLEDKFKDVFSLRENINKEEVAEWQDKWQAKQEAAQKQEDHKLSPCSNIETNIMKHGGFEIAGGKSAEGEKQFSSEILDSRETVTIDKTGEAIREQAVTVRHKRRPAPPVPQLQDSKREDQPSRIDMPTESTTHSYPPVEETKSKTLEQEKKVHPALEGRVEENEEAWKMMASATKAQAGVSPLQYYSVTDGESELDTRLVALPMSESTPIKEASTVSPDDLNEGGWVRCLIDYAKSQTPRSDTSSPSTMRHSLFRVKDNTVRTSPLIKVIKSPLHRVPEDFRLNSPRESWSGSEKGEDERGRLRQRSRAHSPREASASRRAPRLRETPVRSPMPQLTVTTAAQEQTSPQRSPRAGALRHPTPEQEDGCLAVSTLTGRAESSMANAKGKVEEKVTTSNHIEEAEGSKEPSERSESACSAAEVQPLGKPPPVLPKSEKALRRAKRLTNRRMKKAEAESKLERKSRSRLNPVQEHRTEASPPAKTPPLQPAYNPPPTAETRPLQPMYNPPPPAETLPLQPMYNPSPPAETLAMQPAYNLPQTPEFCPEPGQTQPAPKTIAQSFPVTQRKLLQDPDSGQYFMVDLPMQVKTKMFFDPETGKYIQLPVQAPEVVSSRPPSMEILNSPYLLYPGFVPVPITSLPPQGSSSLTPPSETLVEDQEMLQSGSASYRLEDCQQIQCNEAEMYVEPPCVPYDCFPEEPLYLEDEDGINSRIMNAVSMSELDSFAVDNV